MDRPKHAARAVATLPASGQRLPEQLAVEVARRIEEHALKPGTRLPSVRQFASERGVSRSTVVEAYDRLVAQGRVESRRGSGFFVRARRARPQSARAAAAPRAASTLDVLWLLRSMLRQMPGSAQPGSGLLPPDWLDADLIGAALRAVSRSAGKALLGYGSPEGYLPLRQQLAEALTQLDIGAVPEQILTTHGITHAIDLVARHYLAPGDTVFVEDPAWYVMFGRFAAFGANIVGVPRALDGPDTTVLENLLERHKPRLFVVGSVLHNPTGTSISAACAHRLLRLAEQHDFMIVEDDVYGDLHPGRALRLASLDQLRRVIYLGGFSKTLAASLRVGFIAAPAACLQPLTDMKMLTGMAVSELGERVVARVLAEGRYRRHVERLRVRLDGVRERTTQALERMGVRLFAAPEAGLFLWGDFGRDTNAIAVAGAERGVLCAPGSLFSPTQQPGSWMRVSVATALNPAALAFLAESVRQR